MSFQLQYFGPLSVGQNASFAIDYVTQSAIAQGTANAFTYNGLIAGDNVAAIIASNYFLPVVNQLKLGDFILSSATDTNTILYVSAITYPDSAGANASITVELQNDGFSNVNSITGTANQVIASAPTGNVQLSLPQNIAPSSTPTFTGMHVGGLDMSSVNITPNTGTSVSVKANTVLLGPQSNPFQNNWGSYTCSTGSTGTVIGGGTWFNSSTSPSFLVLAKSRGAAPPDFTAVQNGDILGQIQFTGSDGVRFSTAARIRSTVTGTVSSNVVPGSLGFYTTNTSGTSVLAATLDNAQTLSLANALPIASGGTGVTSVTTAPTATSFCGWDGNKNLSANNVVQGYRTTVTNASLSILTVASAYQQYFTGTMPHTLVLPVTSTLVLGQSFLVVNNSTDVLTVNSFGANLIQAMAAGTQILVTCISTTDDTDAAWNAEYSAHSAGVISVTGTANRITSTGGTTPVIDIDAAYVGQSSITTLGTISTGTWSGTTIATNKGGTGVTSVTTSPTASAFAGWDSHSNLLANNFVEGYASTATAAATTTLDVNSAYMQYFTGTTTQTVVLPVTSTLALGQSYLIANQSSGAVTINSSGSNLVQLVAAGGQCIVTCIATSGTTATSWRAQYSSNAAGLVNTTDIVDHAVTYVKMQTSGAHKLLGNPTGVSADVQEVALDSNTLEFNGGTGVLELKRDGSGFILSSASGVAVSSELLNNTGLISITAAQMKALNSTPVLLIAGQGSNVGVVPTRIVMQSLEQTTAYTGGGAVYLQYGATPSGPKASQTLSAATITGLSNGANYLFDIPPLLPTPVDVASIDNAGIYLTCDTADFATGDADMLIQVQYYIQSILPYF